MPTAVESEVVSSSTPTADDPFSDQNLFADLPAVTNPSVVSQGSDFWTRVPSAAQASSVQSTTSGKARRADSDSRSTEDKFASAAIALDGRRTKHLEGEFGESLSTRRVIQWVFFAMLVLGPILGMIGWYGAQDATILARDGETVQGVILEASSSTRMGRKFRVRKRYEFEVAWKGSDDKEHVKTFSVSAALLYKHVGDLGGDEISNPDIQIRYLPSNPHKAVIVGTEFNWGWMLYGGLMCFLVGLAGFATFVYYDIRSEKQP